MEYNPSEFLNQFELDESILDNVNVSVKPENEEYFNSLDLNNKSQLSNINTSNNSSEQTNQIIPPIEDGKKENNIDLGIDNVQNIKEENQLSSTELREKKWNDYKNYYENVQQANAISKVRALRSSTYVPKPALTFDELKSMYGFSDIDIKKKNPYYVLDTQQNRDISLNADFNYISKPIQSATTGDRKVYYSGNEYNIDELIPIQVQAFQKGIFYDENNIPQPISNLSSFDRVVFRQNIFDGNWEAYRTSWMSAPETHVRSIFGYETLDKGTWGGLIARKTIGGTRTILDGIGWITQSFNNLIGIDDPKSHNLFYNIAKSMEYNTPDEKDEGTLAYKIGNIFDGVGQIVGVILPMKIIPPFMRKIGASYEASYITSLYTSRAIMSAGAGGATTKMLMEMGFDQKDANLYGGWATASAFASESIIHGNFAEKAAMGGKINQQMFQESIEEYLKKSGIILNASTSNVSKRIVVQNYTKNFFSKISNMSKSPYSLPFKMAMEEAPEELIENAFNMPYNRYMNAFIYNQSMNTLDKYKDEEIVVENGKTYLVNKWTNVKTQISHERGEIIKNEKNRALKILQNDKWLDEGFNPSEAIYAGLSSLITGMFMIPSHMNAIRDTRDAKQKNTDISYLTYMAMNDKDGIQKIEKSLQDMKNMGVFSKYETTLEGKPVHKGSDEESVADIIINQFMNQIDLHVKAMNAYGITKKEAVESFENNIDIFRNVNIITTKLYKLQNAINNGIENNIDGDLILDTDTVDTLKKKHDELYSEFEYYTKPEPGKKRSNAFNDRMFEVFLTDNYITNLIKETEINQIGLKKYKKLSKEERENFNKNVLLKKQAFVNIEGKINDISMLYKITQDGKTSFNSMSELYKTFADYYYGDKNQVSNFAKEYYSKRNERLKSYGVISDINTINDIEKNIDDIISKTKSPNNISSTEHIDNIVKSLNGIIDGLKSFDITSHSNNSRQNSFDKYNQIKSNLMELKTNIANNFNFQGTVDQKLSLASDQFFAENEGIPIEESMNAQKVIDLEKNIDEVYAKNYGFKAGEKFVDVDNLTKNQIKQSLNDNNNDLSSMFIIDGIDFGFELNELKERTQGDNIEDASGNLEIANRIHYHLQLLEDFLNIEQDVIPVIENNERNKEASPNFNNPRPRFNENTLSKLIDNAKTELTNLEGLIEKLKVATGNKKYGQEKRALMDMSIDLNLIKLIQSYHTSDDKLRDELVSIFVETNDRILSIVNSIYPDVAFDEKKYGNNAILYLVDLYVSEDAKKIEKREAIASKINEIENALLIAKSKYSGKLKEHIVFLKEKIDEKYKNKNTGKSQSINRTEDFSGSNIFDYDSKNVNPDDNMWNSKNFYDSLLDIDGFPHPNSNTEKTIDVTTLYKLNIWNNAGTNGIPTLKSIYDSLREADESVQKHLSTIQNGDAPYLSYVETHEQEEVLVHMLVSTFNNKGSELIDNDLFKNSIYVRGYAGAGKTTVVLSKYIQAVNNLINKGNTTKQKVVVKILTPSENLKQEHINNREMLKLVDNNLVFEYTTFSQFNNGNHGINFSEDIVIIDEASMLGNSEDEIDAKIFFDYIKEGQKTSDTKFVYLGDDSQINHVSENNRNSIHPSKAISKYIEKTIPLTETHRGLVSGINKISNIFRELGSKIINLSNAKSSKFLYNEEYGVDISDTMNSVETKLKEYIDNHKTEHGDYSKFSIIVEDEKDKDAIVAKYGNSIENNIFLLTYNTKNEKKFLSGLSSEKVFILYDFDDRIDIINKNNYLNSRQVLKQEYDKILTAVSRAKHKVVFKWSNNLFSSEYNQNLNISKQATNANAKMIEYQIELEKSIKRREEITKNMLDNKTTISSGILNGQILSYMPNEENALDVATQNASKIILNNKNKKITTALSSQIFNQSKNDINRLRSRILRDLVRTSFIEDEGLRNNEIEDIKSRIEELRTALEKDGYKTGSNFIKNLIDSSLQGPTLYRMNNGNPIIDAELIYTENGKEYTISPTIMSVVGQIEENGVIKPIVDIYDVVSYTTNDSPTEKTEEMLVKTIKAAIDNGFIVNNVQVSIFKLDNGINNHIGDYVYGSNEISDVISKLNLGIDFTSGFSTKEMYFNIERKIYPTRDEELLYSPNMDKVSIDRVTMIYDEKNGYQKTFHVLEEGKIVSYTEKEYKDKYRPRDEFYEKEGLFNSSALEYKNDKSFYTTTKDTIFEYSENSTRVDVKNDMPEEVRKQLKSFLMDNIKNNTLIERVFVENIKYKNDNGDIVEHPFGVIYKYSDEFLKDIESYILLNNLYKKTEYLANFNINTIKEEGLDILSVSALPEFGYIINQNGKKINQTVFQDPIIHQKFIDYVTTGNELSKEFIIAQMLFDTQRNSNDNYIGTNNGTNEDVKNYNIAKMEMFRDAYLNKKTHVTVSFSKHFTQFANKSINDFKEEYDFIKFSEPKSVHDKSSGKRILTIESVKDEDLSKTDDIKSRKIVVFLRTTNILNSNDKASSINGYIDDLISEVDQIQSEFNNVMKKYTEDFKIRGLKKEALSYFKKLRDSKAYRFVGHNRFTLSNLLSTNEFFDSMYDSDKGSFVNNKTIKDVTSLLKNILNQLKNIANNTSDANQIQSIKDLVNPPYHNNNWDYNVLETINGQINEVSLYMKEMENKEKLDGIDNQEYVVNELNNEEDITVVEEINDDTINNPFDDEDDIEMICNK